MKIQSICKKATEVPDWLAEVENIVAAQGRNKRDQSELLVWIIKVSKIREVLIE